MSNGLNLNSIMNVAMFAAGFVTGGATWAMLGQQVFQQIATQAFSQALDSIGIQGPMKDLLMNSFQQGIGGSGDGPFSQDFVDSVIREANHQGPSGQYTGQLDRAINDMARDMAQFITEQGLEREDGDESGRTGSSRRGPGWLQAMAEALGKKLDKLSDEMQDLAKKIDKDDPSTSVDFQVASQQFNILMNTVSTALKTVGEGLANVSRKQ